MSYLVRAIHNLKPNAEFSFTDEDYSTIKWDVLDGDAPSLADINKEIEAIKQKDSQDIIDRATARAALLERLGITADEAALLLG